MIRIDLLGVALRIASLLFSHLLRSFSSLQCLYKTLIGTLTVLLTRSPRSRQPFGASSSGCALLVCDCYIIWHHQPGTLCLSYRYMLPSPCGSFSSRLLCQGWQTTAASSCQSLPEPLCRSCAPCSLLLLCWSQNVNFQYSKNLCMSPFSDTRASQSIPVCLGDFLHSADIISPAVCSGVLPVVSNSATFRLPKVFSES